jgi:hypothetical protein
MQALPRQQPGDHKGRPYGGKRQPWSAAGGGGWYGNSTTAMAAKGLPFGTRRV